ncbi:MAG: nucleoside phosphorylase [Bacteroidales bacterium]|nr:nucleoside phosphorylase [Bacteroidales bacterium]
MRIPESELIINADGSVFHLHMRPEQLADKVILVGDPSRVGLFAELLDSVECRTSSREFVSATGYSAGKRVTVLSTGIGTDNIDIVTTELDALANIDFATREEKPEHRTLEILRIGTCGAIQADIRIGTYIFSSVSIGCDGLLNWYEGRDGICLADYEKAFVEHCRWNRRLADPYFVRASRLIESRFDDCMVKGMTVSAPGFYGPQGRCVRQGLAMPDMLKDFESFTYGGLRILNFEMEGSALAGMARKLGHEAATICCAIANRYLHDANTDYKPLMEKLALLALERL